MYFLPVSLENLIHAKSIESVGREFKKCWSEMILEATVHTICAFANDFFNLNGGYIIIGIEEKDGKPILPPYGLDEENLDKIQKQIRGQCERMVPAYYPVMQPAVYQDKHVLVLFVPGGDNRPYQAYEAVKGKKTEKYYYIRQGSESVKATGYALTQLMQMSAKIPFDDRKYFDTNITMDVLSPSLVRNFLSDIDSDLVRPGVNVPDDELYRHLDLSKKINAHETPKNVALLFFTNDPEKYFRGVRMEIAHFGDDPGGDTIDEKQIKGPIHHQIRQSLDYLNSMSSTMVKKIPGVAEVSRTVAFPYEAMEEAIVNAYYHRSYERDNPEPVKVYLYPDRMEIISYPGPVPGIKPEDFKSDSRIPQVPNRNRRIGDFLKELNLAEGRGTGIPKIFRKMKENGSPEPKFDFYKNYFMVTLPAHPQYIVIHALTESARLWAVGEKLRAIDNLKEALSKVPDSGELVAQIINYYSLLDDIISAENIFNKTKDNLASINCHLPYIAMANAYLNKNFPEKAKRILTKPLSPLQVNELVELAVLHKRTGRYREAHRIFQSNFNYIKDDPKAIHEFAQTKLKLAQSIFNKDMTNARRLDREALELLHRVIQLSDDDVRKAWCWYDIARVSGFLHFPKSQLLSAINKAIELLPHESRFISWRDRLNGKNNGK